MSLPEAEEIASRLTEDGRSVADAPQNIWRLPTIDEAVRSLTRDGQNAGGEWDYRPAQARYKVLAHYKVAPDKESPLWRVRSPVVKWWTSSRTLKPPGGSRSYIITYRGEAMIAFSSDQSRGLGFHAVKGR